VTISGRVIKGEGYGKKLGFPTANIDRRQYTRQGKRVRLGIYAGLVILPNKKSYKSGIVIGPMGKTGLPKLEAHIINYNGNLYGKRIEIKLKKFLRPFKPYRNEQLLKQQIGRDISKIKKMDLYE
jgi:riboflavin kinase/FMN adenylyltransferase